MPKTYEEATAWIKEWLEVSAEHMPNVLLDMDERFMPDKCAFCRQIENMPSVIRLQAQEIKHLKAALEALRIGIEIGKETENGGIST